MLYELHLTTENTVDHDRWIDFCESLNIKPLQIELEGDEPYADQVMFSAVHDGDNGSAMYWSDDLKSAMRDNGFPVIREKMEVPLDKASPYDNPIYHEAHVKSLIHKENVTTVIKFARTHGWIASRNGLFTSLDGHEKWYFTRRAYGVPYFEAGTEFKRAFAELPDFGWHTVRMEMETVIYDDNEELDAGWATLASQ